MLQLGRSGWKPVRGRRTRDGQKSKLYKAERTALNLFDKMEFGSAVECEIFVGRVLANQRARAAVFAAGRPFAPAKTLWPGRVRVRQMKANARGANASPVFGVIGIARTAMTKAVLLHELAHICTPDDVGHGPQYAAVYLALVKSVLGTASYKALKASFKTGKVRFKAKRTLSPERKAALVATLAAARAKRAAIKQPSTVESDRQYDIALALANSQ